MPIPGSPFFGHTYIKLSCLVHFLAVVLRILIFPLSLPNCILDRFANLPRRNDSFQIVVHKMQRHSSLIQIPADSVLSLQGLASS